MAKYHIKKDGTPGVCRAKDGNCPFGNESEHFPTKEEAQNYADKLHERIEKRNKLARLFVTNRNWIVQRVITRLCKDIPEVDETYGSYVNVVIDNGELFLQKNNPVLIAQYGPRKVVESTDINIRMDIDNPENMKIEVEKHVFPWVRKYDEELTPEEEKTYKNIKNRVKERLVNNKDEIIKAAFDSDKFIFNDIDKFHGKSVAEAIEGIAPDRRYVVINNKGERLAETRIKDAPFTDEILSKKINKIHVHEPGNGGGSPEAILLCV